MRVYRHILHNGLLVGILDRAAVIEQIMMICLRTLVVARWLYDKRPATTGKLFGNRSGEEGLSGPN